MPSPGGMTVATLTPYDAQGRVDAGAAREHARWLVEAGIPTLAPAGTTGEALYLDSTEKVALIRAAVEGAAGRAAVVAGIWALHPAEISELHRAAADAGAAAVFLTTPIYYPASDDAVVAFYEFARASGPLPVYAYNIPQYAANSISIAALERLAASGVVEGLKDSTGKIDQLQSWMDHFRGRLKLFGASDGMALRARQIGVDGFISALANIFPQTFLRIWEGGLASSPSCAASEAQAAVDRLRDAVKGAGGIAALKQLLTRREFAFGATRLPFQSVSEKARAELDQALAQCPELG
jgi:4-hydroxy-tetrahydrodipicolinate synthase